MTESALWAALVKAQSEFPTLPKDATNPHFKSKFTPLDTIVEKTRPILAAHGLSWVALPTMTEDGNPALRYRLSHESGEFIEDTMPLLLGSKQDSQGLGAALTYARRYALAAVLNLVADEDDDGNSVSQTVSRPQAQARGNSAGNGNGQRLASAGQRGLIFVRAQENGLSNTQLAAVVLAATGNQPREFADEDAAGDWLRRSMERLPAAKVDPIIEALTA